MKKKDFILPLYYNELFYLNKNVNSIIHCEKNLTSHNKIYHQNLLQNRKFLSSNMHHKCNNYEIWLKANINPVSL